METNTGAAAFDAPAARWKNTERALRLSADLMAKDCSGPAQRIVELELENERLASENEHQRLLLAEAHHRAKNTLALIQAMVGQTLRRASSTEEAAEALSARITALGQAHTLLFEASRSRAGLKDVVEAALAPHGGAVGRISTRGPAAWLDERQTLALSLALHELGTNAVKYGALSNLYGRVEITWRAARRSSGRRLRLTWSEHGGPPVSLPRHEGFGSKLIRRVLADSIGAEVKVCFAPGGLVCTMAIALQADH